MENKYLIAVLLTEEAAKLICNYLIDKGFTIGPYFSDNKTLIFKTNYSCTLTLKLTHTNCKFDINDLKSFLISNGVSFHFLSSLYVKGYLTCDMSHPYYHNIDQLKDNLNEK